jgi:hypothetical protein
MHNSLTVTDEPCRRNIRQGFHDNDFGVFTCNAKAYVIVMSTLGNTSHDYLLNEPLLGDDRRHGHQQNEKP